MVFLTVPDKPLTLVVPANFNSAPSRSRARLAFVTPPEPSVRVFFLSTHNPVPVILSLLLFLISKSPVIDPPARLSLPPLKPTSETEPPETLKVPPLRATPVTLPPSTLILPSSPLIVALVTVPDS